MYREMALTKGPFPALSLNVQVSHQVRKHGEPEVGIYERTMQEKAVCEPGMRQLPLQIQELCTYVSVRKDNMSLR
jgi:hypothetical protein